MINWPLVLGCALAAMVLLALLWIAVLFGPDPWLNRTRRRR